MKPILKGEVMIPTYEQLVEKQNRLERNLLNAVDERTAIAIYKMINTVSDQIFNHQYV
jgi:hypothetical protein